MIVNHLVAAAVGNRNRKVLSTVLSDVIADVAVGRGLEPKSGEVVTAHGEKGQQTGVGRQSIDRLDTRFHSKAKAKAWSDGG